MPTPPTQSSLFDDEENRALTVAAALPRGKSVDRRQAAFQRLIRQIEEERALLADWQSYQTRYAQRVSNELMPLQARVREVRIGLAHLLDEQYQRPGVLRGKGLRKKLRAMIVDLVQELLAEAADPTLVALHDRYSDLRHAELAELEQELSRAMIEDMFGVQLSDADPSADIEAMLARALDMKQQEEAAREEKRPSRRKTAKAAAAEAKRAEAEKQVSQSVREVYRKLASTLHPDRASADFTPEQKTILMQRVNRAYDAGDLLELLNIQLEIEQIDAVHLANLPAERIDHYNQVLRDQLAEMKSEVESLVAPFRALVPFVYKLRHGDVDRALDGEIARLRIEAQRHADDSEALRDPKRLAEAVKHYQPNDGLDGLDADIEAFGELMEGLATPRRRRRAT